MAKLQTSNFKPQSFCPDGFLLNGAQRNVFSPERSGGLFIEFCQHEVPSLLPCRMEANLFAYSRHDSDDAGRSPRQNVFLFFYLLSSNIVVTRRATARLYLRFISMVMVPTY